MRTDGHGPVLGRRPFLAATGAALAVVGPPRHPGRVDPDRFALFADTHVDRDPCRHASPENASGMAGNLALAVDAIGAPRIRPAGVIVAGDIAYDRGEAGDYSTFDGLVSPLVGEGVPIHLALGNHDHRDRLGSGFPLGVPSPVAGRRVEVVQTRRARWVLLDSLDPVQGEPSGALGAGQRAWLTALLDAAPDTPTLLVCHHDLQFAPSPAGTYDGLRDSCQLLEVIKGRRQVKAIFHGHTHAWDLTEYAGVHVVGLPALGYSFNQTGVPVGWVDVRLGASGMDLTVYHGFIPYHCPPPAGGRAGQVTRRRYRLPWRVA